MDLQNISRSVYGFFIILLLASLSAVVLFRDDEERIKDIGREIPNIEITNFDFSLLQLDTFALHAKGEKLFRFAQYDEAFNFYGYQPDSQNKLQEVYAPYVKAQEKFYYFSQGLQYTSENGLRLWSEDGVYDYKNALLRGRGIFTLKNAGTDLQGQDLVFNHRTGMVSGANLEGTILLQ